MSVKLEPNITPETIFLREFVRSYGNSIGWSPEAEAQMTEIGISLPQILQAMKTAIVIDSDREDEYGSIFEVVGMTCDDDELYMRLKVHSFEGRVRVLSVEKC